MARGEITHIELPADDIERAKAFYEAVAGWSFGKMEGSDDYWLFRTGEGSGGAIGRRGGDVSSVIRPYITVARLEDAIAAGEVHGGRVIQPPSPVEGMGRYAAMIDPEGTEIGLWEDAPEG